MSQCFQTFWQFWGQKKIEFGENNPAILSLFVVAFRYCLWDFCNFWVVGRGVGMEFHIFLGETTEFHWFWVKNNTARAARKKIGCIFHVHKNCMPQCFQNIEYYISEKNRILKTACPSVFRIFNIQISGVWKSESSTLVGYRHYRRYSWDSRFLMSSWR